MSPRIRICREPDCQDQATTKGFCRFHYLKNWNRIRKNRRKNAEELNRYVEQVVERNPKGYLGEISRDIHRWDDGDYVGTANDGYIDEVESEESGIDNILDNLKVDDDF